MSPEQRAALIAHMKSRAAVTTRLLVQAVVLDSLLQRTLFYAVNLIFPNPFPSRRESDPRPGVTCHLAQGAVDEATAFLDRR